MTLDTVRSTPIPTPVAPQPAKGGWSRPALRRTPLRDALAWSSLGAAFAGVGLLFIGDPYWLALWLGCWALVAGMLAIWRDDEPRAVPYMGASVGLGVVMLWFIMDVVVGVIAGFDLRIIEL